MKHKHLTLSDCFEIELSIRQGSSFREIVAKIEKDTSTVSKKIRKHLVIKQLDERKKLPPCDCLNKLPYCCNNARLSVVNVDIINKFTKLSMRNVNMRLNYLTLVKESRLIRRVFIK